MGQSRAPEIDEGGFDVKARPKVLLDFDASQTVRDIIIQRTNATDDALG